MVACVTDRIVAAPFAFVGSVGVVAMMPNVAKALHARDVKYLQFTGGRYKRTVTPFTEPTDEATTKLQAEIDDIHDAFKKHVDENRDLELDDVATGESWLAALAPEGVVDDLATSGELLREKMTTADVILVAPATDKPKSLLAALRGAAAHLATSLATGLPPNAIHERVRAEPT